MEQNLFLFMCFILKLFEKCGSKIYEDCLYVSFSENYNHTKILPKLNRRMDGTIFLENRISYTSRDTIVQNQLISDYMSSLEFLDCPLY